MIRDWTALRAPEFKTLDPARTIAILPTAAIEQHGPHLPVGTDTLIAEGMIAELRRQAPDDLDLLMLPVQAVGKSNEHLWAQGTVTLPWDVVIRAWTEIGHSVARAGVRKLLMVNSHGGNLPVNEIVARELRVQAGMYVVKCAWGAFGHPTGAFSEREQRFGIHGGDVETSLLLHFRPDTVDMAAARDFASTAEGAAIPPTGPISYGWISTDVNQAGVVGEAQLASAEKGREMAEHAVRGIVGMLRKVATVDWAG
jgi:creatinine amidohydrolase